MNSDVEILVHGGAVFGIDHDSRDGGFDDCRAGKLNPRMHLGKIINSRRHKFALFLEVDIALALESLRSIGPLCSFGLDIRLFEQARRRETKCQYLFPCLAIPRALAERFFVQVVEKRIDAPISLAVIAVVPAGKGTLSSCT